MSKIIENLSEFGLDKKASKIYLFLLENRDIPVYKIASETGIPRTTVYKTLEKMEKDNIVSSWNKNNIKHYSANSPDSLKRIIRHKENALNEIYSELKSIYGVDRNTPKTRILVGKEGVKIAFEHILETMIDNKIKQVYVFSEPQLTEALPKFFVEWREKKNKATKAFTQMIVPASVSVLKNYQSDEFRETRELKDGSLFMGSVDIIGDNVYFFSFKEKEIYSIIIESSIVASMMTNLFRYIWNTLK